MHSSVVLCLIYLIVPTTMDSPQRATKYEVVFVISGSDDFGGSAGRVFSDKIGEVVGQISRSLLGDTAEMSDKELQGQQPTVTFATVFGHTSSTKQFTTVTQLSPMYRRVVKQLLSYLKDVKQADAGSPAGITGSIEYCGKNVFTDSESTAVAKIIIFLVHTRTKIAEVEATVKDIANTMVVFIVFPYLTETCQETQQFASRLKKRSKVQRRLLFLVSLAYCGMEMSKNDIGSDVGKLLGKYQKRQEERSKEKAASAEKTQPVDVAPDEVTEGDEETEQGSSAFAFHFEICPKLYCQWWFIIGAFLMACSALCSVPLMIRNAIDVQRLHANEARAAQLRRLGHPSAKANLTNMPSGSYFLTTLALSKADNIRNSRSPSIRSRAGSESTVVSGVLPSQTPVDLVSFEEKPALASMMAAALSLNPMLAAEHHKAVQASQRVRKVRKAAKSKKKTAALLVAQERRRQTLSSLDSMVMQQSRPDRADGKEPGTPTGAAPSITRYAPKTQRQLNEPNKTTPSVPTSSEGKYAKNTHVAQPNYKDRLAALSNSNGNRRATTIVIDKPVPLNKSNSRSKLVNLPSRAKV